MEIQQKQISSIIQKVQKIINLLKKSSNDFYIWITGESDSCAKCKELSGRIFDYKPKVEEITHPHCKCRVEPINQINAEKIIKNHEVEIEKRDVSIEYLEENAKVFKNGTWYDKFGNHAKTNECAKYVSDALLKGGVNLRKHQNRNEDDYFRAYKYGTYLENEGFLTTYSHEKTRSLLSSSYESKKGDVIVIQKTDDGSHENGHIAMFNGKFWISDFKQNTIHGLKDKKIEDLNFKIYRNKNWIDWNN